MRKNLTEYRQITSFVFPLVQPWILGGDLEGLQFFDQLALHLVRGSGRLSFAAGSGAIGKGR